MAGTLPIQRKTRDNQSIKRNTTTSDVDFPDQLVDDPISWNIATFASLSVHHVVLRLQVHANHVGCFISSAGQGTASIVTEGCLIIYIYV